MDDKTTFQSFGKLLGLRIIEISYIETKFYHDFHSDWTNVNTDLFVLHSPEWQISFSNGQKWFLTNPQEENKPGKSNITISSTTIEKPGDKIHSVPNSFGWKNILDKEISKIKFYKRVLTTKSLLGYEISKSYQEHIQIIQFFCSDKSFSITTMDGDIGRMDFYPTGYLSDRLGFFFDKTIVESHTSLGITMRMEMVHKIS